MWALFSGVAVAGPSLAVEPSASMAPAPASVVGTAWVEALQAQGAQISEDFGTQVAALHPILTGAWSAPFYAHVVGMGTAVALTGTITVEASRLAEARVELVPRGQMGGPEVWAWNRMVRRARQDASRRLEGQATTPGAVLATVAEELSDPLRCGAHLSVLHAAGTSEALALVMNTEKTIADDCRPASVALVAARSSDPLIWPAWFRRAWLGAGPERQDALVDVLRNIEDRPADLEFLLADVRAREKVDAWVREKDQRAMDLAPLQCADGTIDRSCTCGSPKHQCCVHHGGVDRCLPPPPNQRPH